MNLRGDLELDHETHTYTVGGARVPGVSQILTALGIVDRSWFTDYARDRGIAVHAAMEYHLTGGLDFDSIDPAIRGYVDAGISFLKDAKVVPGAGTIVERSLWHPLHLYAGTLDLVCEAFGQPSVVDFKSGGVGEAAGLQTAAYELLARVAYPLSGAGQTRRRMAVQLLPDGRYRKHDLADGFDYPHFQAASALFNRFHLHRIQKGVDRAA